MAYECESEIYTLDYFLQDNVCRFCWNKEAFRGLSHADKGLLKGELLDKIRDCLELDISEDIFPQNICESCYLKIEEFYKFKSFCRHNHRRLQEITLNSSIQTYEVKIEAKEDFTPKQVFTDTLANELKEGNNSYEENIKRSKKPRLSKESNYDSSDSNHYEDQISCDESSETNKKESNVKKKKVKIKTAKTLENLKTEPGEVSNALSMVKKKRYILKRSVSYCNICRNDLGSKESLSLHNSTNHGIEEGNIFKCFGCEKRFKSRKARLAHEINFCKGLKEGYKCLKCDRYLPRRSMYEAHMRDHRENPSVELPEKIFQCAKCFSLFETKLSLKEHMDTHESGRKNYVCETCGRVFTRQDYLHKHKLTHTGTKQHVCTQCGYRTSQKSSLTVHIRKHTGERPYRCEQCPQRCISSSNLRAHMRRHLGQKKFECSICNKKFGYKISLEEHIASIHERSQAFSCEHCGAIYTRVRGLRRHLLAKHSKHQPTDGSTCQEKESTELFIKIPEDGAKKDLKVDEVFQIKECEEFVLLNADAVLLTKMY